MDDADRSVTGYLHQSYAQALAEFGIPRYLPACEGWILEREVPGRDEHDAMGCYPLFCCRNWRRIGEDLARLNPTLVTLSLVTDPFGDYTPEMLTEFFGQVELFKEHYVVDLRRPRASTVSKHHRESSRWALRNVKVERCENPAVYLDDWVELYASLAARRGIAGLTRFSRESFSRQLAVPGMLMFRATHAGRTIGARIYCVHGRFAYSHLSAFSSQGYALRASYALHWTAIEQLREHVDWLDIGAGAGLRSGANDGLAHFKSGWSSETRPVYFCGRVFDRHAYSEINTVVGARETDYFPAYRRGEFS